MPTPLHSPHLPALHGKRQADVGLQLLFCCKAGQLWAVCSSRPEPGGESAGCVRLQCLFCGLFVCLLPLCLPCPLPSQVLAPVQLLCPRPVHFAFVACPVHFHVRQDRRVRASSLQAARTVPLAAATRACSGGPCARSILTFLIPAESIDPGPWG